MRAALHDPRPDATAAGLWSSFWKDAGPDNAPHARCHVPGDGRPVVDRHWSEFADGLPHGAQVIDLACGAGIVGATLLNCRADLRVAGIDCADVPVGGPANLTIHRWVSMEALPFDDGSFDAAVSLFGIEYGDIDQTAAELARVLKPDARFSFLVHHSDSEILREGGTRRRAVRDVLSGKMRAAFLGGHAAGVDLQRRRLMAAYPGEPSMTLLVDHLRRNLSRTRAERQAVWDRLTADFGPELSLLAHLERSAKSAAGLGAWLSALLAAMRHVDVSVLRRGSGEPIAWAVGGIR